MAGASRTADALPAAFPLGGPRSCSELQDLLFAAIEQDLSTLRADLASKISLILKRAEV
jgi:hypothetical protein